MHPIVPKKSMKIALVQFKPKLSRENLNRHIEILESIDDSVELVIFPELSLNGYYLQDSVFDDAWRVDELQQLSNISKKVDIVVGGAIRERKSFYNSSLYFSKGELIHNHKKLHLPNYGLFEEARFFKHGDQIESFNTKFGKTISLVCEDIWRGSTLSEIEQISPDFITVISNSPARGFKDGKVEIIDKWKALLKTASIIADSKVIFVNRVGFEDGLGFWGGSMIFDRGGEELLQLPLYDEKIEIFEF